MTWGQLEATPQRAMTPGGASTSDKKVPGVSTIASNAPAFRMDSSKIILDLRSYLYRFFSERQRRTGSQTYRFGFQREKKCERKNTFWSEEIGFWNDAPQTRKIDGKDTGNALACSQCIK